MNPWYLLFPWLPGAQQAVANVEQYAANSAFSRAIVILTNRGILIRTGVTLAGSVLVVIGIVMLLRKPIANAAVTAGKVAAL